MTPCPGDDLLVTLSPVLNAGRCLAVKVIEMQRSPADGVPGKVRTLL